MYFFQSGSTLVLNKRGVIIYTYRCKKGDSMISLRSEITKKLLNYFFINPHESLYVNEMSQKLQLDKRNLVKKIKE